jgi:hypothetical protein
VPRPTATTLQRLFLLAGSLLGGGLCMGTSCLNPCEQLAQKICSCESTESERQACTRQAKIQQDQRQIDNDDRLFCQKTLGTCECRALAEGRLEVCGLSRE